MRLTRAEVDLASLKHNYDRIREFLGNKVTLLGIVKANAYGHGLVEVSQSLVEYGIDYLGVGFLEEGIELRRSGLYLPILVLGGVLGSQVREFLSNDLEITISSVEIAERIDHEARTFSRRKARVHLKIDTGMERIGVRSENALQFIERVCRLPHLEVVGLYSHFATAGETDNAFAQEQLGRFGDIVDKVRAQGIEVQYCHMANSAAMLEIPESHFTMVRPGIVLYGISPFSNRNPQIPLRPVLSLRSKVVFIKEVPEGRSISYGRKYFTARRTKIATIPVGYGDGFRWQLTNRGEVLIRGRRYPVVGSVCMDQIMVDLGPSTEVHVGDEVVLIGSDGAESITAWELAEKVGTIPYEICIGLTSRVPRIFHHH